MNVEVTTLPESRVALKVELTPGEVDQALDRTYRQLVQRVAIPGFRKGKAPRSVVERTVGPDLFLHEATEDAMRWGYRKAIDQEKLVPIDEAEVSAGDDHDHLDVGREFSFEATVSVKPDVQLPDYRGLEIDRSVVEVSDEDVDNLLHDLQERTATLEPTSSPADEGMVVTMNIAGKVGGREIVNEENGEFELRDEERQGSDPVFPGLSRELIGVKPGDIKDIALLLPEMYRDDELAGKTLALRILVKEIKRKILPELGDELAQSVSEMKTLDELRGRLRDNIEIERKYAADQELADRVADAVTSRTFVEIPRVLVEEELDRGVEEMRRAFDSQRLSLDAYLQTTGKSAAELRNEMREEAIQTVKKSLVLGAVADQEGVDVTSREIDRAVDEVLRAATMPEREKRRLRSSAGVRSNIRSRLQRQRAIQRLVQVVTGGDEVSDEAAEVLADQTATTSEGTEETVPAEVGG